MILYSQTLRPRRDEAVCAHRISFISRRGFLSIGMAQRVMFLVVRKAMI